MQNNTLQIHHDLLSFEEVKNFINNAVHIAIAEDTEQRIVKCRNFLDNKLAADDSLFYGINTGFGHEVCGLIRVGQQLIVRQRAFGAMAVLFAGSP